MLDKYKLVGRSYDLLSKLYSGDAIAACKVAMLREDTLGPGSRVLFAGSGQGKDAIVAASLGAQVTVVDISPTMMSRFKKILESQPDSIQERIEMVQIDILKLEKFDQYDMVVANFFLNVFDRKKMNTLLKHLIKLLRPKGRIIIGDFAPPQGGLLGKSVQNLYWYAAATAFFAAAGNAVHAIYHYREILEKQGCQIMEERFFPVLGQNWYQSLMAQKP